jgi:hypothetical protein
MARNNPDGTAMDGTWIAVLTAADLDLTPAIGLVVHNGAAAAELYSEGLHGLVAGDDPGAARGCPVPANATERFTAATRSSADGVRRLGRCWIKAASGTAGWGVIAA